MTMVFTSTSQSFNQNNQQTNHVQPGQSTPLASNAIILGNTKTFKLGMNMFTVNNGAKGCKTCEN